MDNTDSKPQQTGGLKLMTVFIAVLALHVLVIGGFTVYHLMGSGSDADLTLDKNHKLKADGTLVTETTAPDATAADKTADATASTDTATTPSSTGSTTAATTATATTTPDAKPATTETAMPAAAPSPVPAMSPAPSTPTQVAANSPETTAPATPAKSGAAPIVLSGDDMSQTSTVPPDGLAPPPEPVPASSAPAVNPASVSIGAPAAPQVASVHAPAAPASTHSAVPAVPSVLSSSAPSGPVIPSGAMAAGPVHMPANSPVPSATTNVASHEEHVSVPSHEEHAVASAHVAKKETYTVKMTDTYKKIAESHHITVAELKAANHIKGSAPMHTGEKLIIPSGKTSVAKSGATHDTSASETASVASLSATPAGSAKSHRHYYTVTKGDTLKYIAKKFNVTPSALEEANNLNGSKVAVGEKLRIPSHESRPAASAGTSSASLTDRVAAPVAAPMAAPAPIQPSQVETQPAPVEQPASTPVATPSPEPQPTPASSPELTSLNF